MKTLFKKIMLIMLAFTGAIIVLAFFAITTGNNLSEIKLFTSSLTATLRPWRWLVLSCIVFFWPQLIGFIAQRKNLKAERIAYGLSLRWRVAVYLIIFEVIIIEAIPAHIYGAL